MPVTTSRRDRPFPDVACHQLAEVHPAPTACSGWPTKMGRPWRRFCGRRLSAGREQQVHQGRQGQSAEIAARRSQEGAVVRRGRAANAVEGAAFACPQILRGLHRSLEAPAVLPAEFEGLSRVRRRCAVTLSGLHVRHDVRAGFSHKRGHGLVEFGDDDTLAALFEEANGGSDLRAHTARWKMSFRRQDLEFG